MREADNLTTFLELKPPGTIWATPGLLRDSFTFAYDGRTTAPRIINLAPDETE